MPNITPTLLATISQLEKKDYIDKVILNSKEAALLKEGEHFTRKVPPNRFISSAEGVLNGSIIVIGWDLVPLGQMSVLRGLELGLLGSMDNWELDPQFFVPIRYLEEPLYELGEAVSVDSQIGIIQGVLKMQAFDQVQMCLPVFSSSGLKARALSLLQLSCKLGVVEICERIEKAKQEVFEEKLAKAPQVTLVEVSTNPKKYEGTLVSFSRVRLSKVTEGIGFLQDDPPKNSIRITIPDDAPQSLRAKWACLAEGAMVFSNRPIIGVYKDTGYGGEHVLLLLSIKAEVDCR